MIAKNGSAGKAPVSAGSHGLPGSPTEFGFKPGATGPTVGGAPRIGRNPTGTGAVRQHTDFLRRPAHGQERRHRQEQQKDADVTISRAPTLVERDQRDYLNVDGAAHWSRHPRNGNGNVAPPTEKVDRSDSRHHPDEEWIADGTGDDVGDNEL